MGKLAKFHESHLPVWAAGNAYLCGAKPWKHEKINLVAPADGLTVELTEQDGRTYLRTNLFDHIATLHCGLIDSDVLGCAFEPEQRFESPDGSAITFDRDYFGSHRGLRILPGPFAAKEDADRPLW